MFISKYNIFRFSIFCLFLFLFQFHPVSSQTRHYLDVWAGGGYDALLHGIKGTKVPGGGGFNAGLGYELNVNNFIVQSGAEFMYFGSKTRLLNYLEDYTYLYMDGHVDRAWLWYYFNFLEYSEKHRAAYVNIPVMFGLKFNRYYALLGTKIGLNLFGAYRSDAQVQFDMLDYSGSDVVPGIDEMVSRHQEGDLSFGLNVTASAEFGVTLDEWLPEGMTRLNNTRRTPLSYRAGVFIDYGLTNLNTSPTVRNMVEPSENDPQAWQMASLPESTSAQGKRFGNLYAGVKLSVLFQLNQERRRPAARRPSASEPISFYAHVTDAETGENLNVEVEARQGNRQLFKQQTDSEGMVSHSMRKGRYTFSVKSEGYLDYRKTHSHVKVDTLEIALQPVPAFAVHVYDADSRANLSADVVLTRASDNASVYEGRTDAATGVFSYDLRSGRYQVSVSSEGYIYQQRVINFTQSDTLEFALQAIKKDVKVVLHNLFFELNKAEIMPESGPALEDLYQFLLKNPEVKIHIVGHTDNTGTVSYNMELSKARAQAIYDVIVSKGISAERLTFEGRGPNEPVSTNDTEEGRAANRRVEFVIR